MQLTQFKALTFDCYGTLIDWETGILDALKSLAARSPALISRDRILERFAQNESEQEAETPAMLYPQLLAAVYKRLGRAWGLSVTDDEAGAFGASISDWPAFPDSADALRYLKKHHKLFILSNVDRDSFQASNARLGVEFDGVYTAQDVGTYKPSALNFEYMLRRLKEDFSISRTEVLHVAQSLYHDHVPASRLGLASAWIDRRHAAKGCGATKPPPETPKYNFRFESMENFVEAHQNALLD